MRSASVGVVVGMVMLVAAGCGSGGTTLAVGASSSPVSSSPDSSSPVSSNPDSSSPDSFSPEVTQSTALAAGCPPPRSIPPEVTATPTTVITPERRSALAGEASIKARDAVLAADPTATVAADEAAMKAYFASISSHPLSEWEMSGVSLAFWQKIQLIQAVLGPPGEFPGLSLYGMLETGVNLQGTEAAMDCAAAALADHGIAVVGREVTDGSAFTTLLTA